MAGRCKSNELEKYFLKNLQSPKWTDSLTEDDLKSGTIQAVSILQFIAITRSSKYLDNKTMNMEGKLMLDSILFLSQDDLMKTIEALNQIVTLVIPNRSSITMDLNVKNVPLSIADGCVFNAVTIIAIRNALPLLQNIPVSKQILSNILSKLIFPQWIASPYLIYTVKTVYLLLKNLQLNLYGCASLFLNLMSAHALGSSNNKIIEYSLKITEIMVRSWNQDEKFAWFNALLSIEQWEPGHCQVVMYIVSNWPTNLTLPNLDLLLERVSVMLAQKMVGTAAIKLLQAAIPLVTINIWTTKFVKDLISMMPSNLEERRAFVRSTLLECTNLAVKHYGKAVYENCNSYHMDMSYNVLALFCSVKQGLIDINDQRKTIELMLLVPDDLIQYYTVKMLCHFSKKTYQISKWHIHMIELYLQNLVFANNNFYCYELNYFVSHMCVQSNCIIKQESYSEQLIIYEEFFSHLYRFCIENIKSRDQHKMSIAAQIFNLVQEICVSGSTFLKIKYSLNKDDEYTAGQCPLLCYLMSVTKWYFGSIATLTILVREFIHTPKVFPDLSNMIKKWCVVNLSPDASELQHLFRLGIVILENKIDKESIEKGRRTIDLVLSNYVYYSRNCSLPIKQIFDKWIAAIKQLGISSPVFTFNIARSGIGLTYCIYDLLKNNYIAMSEKNQDLVFQIFESCNVIISNLLHPYPVPDAVNSSKFVIGRIEIKGREQIIIICLDLIALILENYSSSSRVQCAVEIANKVILASCGRSPVATAAATVRRICGEILSPSPTDQSYSKDQQQIVIIKFLERVLYSIYTASENQISNIRRNPEHRLIIHSIVVADQLPNHPCLVRAMDFLLDVLSEPSSPSSSIASALHTLEALVVDNTIRNSTLPFISSIAIHCIDEFSSNDWKIKNAAIQVLQALVNRVLGPTCNAVNRRYTTIEDIFVLHPSLALYFHSKLQNCHVEAHGSIIAILALFSESHSKLNIFLSNAMKFIISCFAQKFVNFICKDAGIVGLFATKAYAAIYPHAYIPFIMQDIVEWVQLNFCRINKNIFYSISCLLQALYEKFNLYPKVFYYASGLCIIQSVFQSWFSLVERLNYKYEFSLFSLLSIKSNGIGKSEKAVFDQLQRHTYQSRLWLHNNIPYILHNIDIQQFPNFLGECLNQPLSLSLLRHCLSGILTRYEELIEHSLAAPVLTVVIDKFLQLSNMCEYLVCSFSHVILLLFESCNLRVTKDLIKRLRSSYKVIDVTSIYILAVYLALLSRFKDYLHEDLVFIKGVLAVYKDVSLIEDAELQLHIASTLKYLYKCVEIPDRYQLLKIAFILLLNRETGLEICKFVAVSFNVEFSSVYTTLHTLISVDNLTKQLGSTLNVATFLVDLTLFVSSLNDAFQDCGEFYMKQNSDICSHKNSVKNILLETVRTAFELLPREDCLKVLNNVDST